jgi:arsenate reductase
MSYELWHNPRCSKSRGAKELLDEAGVTYTERRYVDSPPSRDELERVLTALDKQPWEIARLGEPVAAELGLAQLEHDREEWIEIMVANPILIERPILVTSDGRALLGRPPESLRPLLP